MANVVMRFPRVLAATGLSRSTIWRLEAAGEFPKRVQLSANAVGWRADEVESWIEARARKQSAAEGLQS
jgi:prophage regulatory protein